MPSIKKDPELNPEAEVPAPDAVDTAEGSSQPAEVPAPDVPAAAPAGGRYRVVHLAVSYRDPETNGGRRAYKGHTIEVGAKEAARLLGQGAVVADGEPDPPLPPLPDGENPYGGKRQVSLEAHAAAVRSTLP